jgi:hypothetical protein
LYQCITPPLPDKITTFPIAVEYYVNNPPLALP